MSRLNDGQKLLLKLVSSEITGNKIDISDKNVNDTDWKALFKEAVYQSVPIMAAEAVSPYKDKISVYPEIEKYVMRCVYSNIRNLGYEEELGVLLGNKKYAIIKGTSSASYYCKPFERALGDIDFLIDPSDRKEITDILLKNGFEKNGEDHICHDVFTCGGAHLEMHFEIAGIPYGECGDVVRQEMKRALDFVVTKSSEGHTFKCLDDYYHGIVILIHMQHHMLGEGIGLRHLCDWACYVEKTRNEPFWEKLLAFFKKIGLLTYAKAMTKTGALCFSLECPEWAADFEEDLCYDIAMDIFTGGNFGQKDKTRANSGALISDHGKNGTRDGVFSNSKRAFLNSVRNNYPIVKKVPVLWAIFAPVGALRLLLLSATGKKGLNKDIFKKAEERLSIYERLHVFETEDKDNNK